MNAGIFLTVPSFCLKSNARFRCCTSHDPIEFNELGHDCELQLLNQFRMVNLIWIGQ